MSVAVNAGPVANRRRLDALTFASVADMVAANYLSVGQKCRTLGRLAAGDGGGNDYEIVTAGTGADDGGSYIDCATHQAKGLFPGGLILDAQFLALSAALAYAKSVNKQVVITADSTINVPTDAATLQDAFDYTEAAHTVAVTVKLETAQSPAVGLNITNRDYRNYSIESVDATVNVDALAPSQFMVFTTSHAPAINIFIDGQGVVDEMYRYINSVGRIEPTKGGQNCTGRVLYANNSQIQAGSTVWASSEEIFCTNGTGINLGAANISAMTLWGATFSEGATGSVANATFTDCFGGLHCKDASVVDGEFATISGCTEEAVRVDGAIVILDRATLSGLEAEGIECISGQVVAPDINISSNGTTTSANSKGIRCRSGSVVCTGATIDGMYSSGIEALSTGSVNAGTAVITNTAGHGVYALQSGKVDFSGGSSTGSGGDDLRISQGAQISAFGATTTNGVGTPALADTNLIGGFNIDAANGSRGFIWV